MIQYFENGEVKSRVNFVKGVQDGVGKFYYSQGAIKREVNFKSGIQQDTMKIYYENGNLMELSFLVDGVKNGIFSDYYENGNIKSKGNAKDNDRDGEWLFYQQDGSLDRVAFFINGQEVSSLLPSENNKKYKNALLKYSFTVPDSFDKVQETKDFVLFVLDKEGFKPSFNVLSNELNDNIELTEFVGNELESINNLTSEFVLLRKESSESKIKIDYRAKYENYNVKVSTLFISRDNYVFIVTFMSESAQYYSDEMNLVFSSFNLES